MTDGNELKRRPECGHLLMVRSPFVMSLLSVESPFTIPSTSMSAEGVKAAPKYKNDPAEDMRLLENRMKQWSVEQAVHL